MAKAPKLHLLRILDVHGDTTIRFDPKSRSEVDEIDRRFCDLMERGFTAFDVSTMPGRIMKTFDPNATEVIITPRYAGG